MCVANPEVEEMAAGEVRKILANGVDYVQYFDQNLGGAGHFCYSKNHGHPPGPGPWITSAMAKIDQRLMTELERSKRPALLGCESAASEPFLPYLLFNDARFNINLHCGRPVPAYAYVYHEYTNNFMGNQNWVFGVVDVDRSPWNLHQRIAYSFTAGDMLTVVLGGKSSIIWDWGTPWNRAQPDQESVVTLVHNLNAWRKGDGAAYMMHGRMLKPNAVEGTRDVPMTLKEDYGVLHFPSLFTSRWQTQDGRDGQIVVNYLKDAQTATLVCPSGVKQVRIAAAPGDPNPVKGSLKRGRVVVTVPALSAVMVEFGKS
jgi:hypothetical protein